MSLSWFHHRVRFLLACSRGKEDIEAELWDARIELALRYYERARSGG